VNLITNKKKQVGTTHIKQFPMKKIWEN